MSEETTVLMLEDNVIAKLEENPCSSKVFDVSNKMYINGRLEAEFEYSHEAFGKKFYYTRVIVTRRSGTQDMVPIVIADWLLKKNRINKSSEGKYVEVAGQFRTHNKLDEEGHKRLEVFLYAKAINIYETEDEHEKIANTNLIYLDGYFCKPPLYRETPLGKRITDFIIAVNRCNGESDYIPCIAWEKLAQWTSTFEVGDRIILYGRVQSRKYFKKYSEDSEEGEYRETYEVSVIKMKKCYNLTVEESI